MQKEFYLKHHRPHIREVFNGLRKIFQHGHYADKAIEQIMRANKNWDVRERTFVAETIYDIVRNWRLLHAAADVEDGLTEKNLWTLFGVWLLKSGFSLPDFAGFKPVNAKKVAERFEKLKKVRKINESLPDWLDELCAKELGAKWDKVAHALNQKANMVLRTNTLKTTQSELKELLSTQYVETSYLNWAPGALELMYSRNVFRTDAFKQGLFEVQDAGSQMVSSFLDVHPGMRVIDACAGTGGKTLHLAALMKNKGRIIAMDTKEWKLQEMKKRSSRAGASIIESRVIDSTKTIKRLQDSADRLLLDVPCSGLGVLRRNPDAKWKLQPEEIERVRQQQAELLERFYTTLKPGGKMVYATCSILPSEGEEQIKSFMSKHPGEWNLSGEKRYSPETHHCDGFYMALLERIKK